jgi:hypothetical protein
MFEFAAGHIVLGPAGFVAMLTDFVEALLDLAEKGPLYQPKHYIPLGLLLHLCHFQKDTAF